MARPRKGPDEPIIHKELSEKKECTQCHEEKLRGEFRVRFKRKNGKKYEYTNATCRVCDREATKQRNKRLAKDPVYVAKRNERVRMYASKNKEKISAQKAEKRKTPEYKAYVKKYYEKNKEKIAKQHSVVCKKASEELRPWIVSGRLRQSHFTADEIKSNPDLVELKKLKILLNRQLKIVTDGTI